MNEIYIGTEEHAQQNNIANLHRYRRARRAKQYCQFTSVLKSTQSKTVLPFSDGLARFLGEFEKIANNNYQFRHVCPSVSPSVRMEQLRSQWTNFLKYGI